MGFLGDLFDDVTSLPSKALDFTLGIPADVVAAARKAGCKTKKEIEEFHKLMLRTMDGDPE